MNILLGVTGSVATLTYPKLSSELRKLGELKVVATKNAEHFIEDNSGYHVDNDEWVWEKKGDPILHIELRKWADIMVIAPLSANTLAKIANGFCDNLLTSVIRAWDWKNKKIFFAPAMNTYMWDNIITSTHVCTLTSWGAILIPPVSKTLACGDVGIGAMARVEDIVTVIRS